MECNGEMLFSCNALAAVGGRRAEGDRVWRVGRVTLSVRAGSAACSLMVTAYPRAGLEQLRVHCRIGTESEVVRAVRTGTYQENFVAVPMRRLPVGLLLSHGR